MQAAIADPHGSAARLLFDRVEGKLGDRVEVEVPVPSIEDELRAMSPEDRAKLLDQLRAKRAALQLVQGGEH